MPAHHAFCLPPARPQVWHCAARPSCWCAWQSNIRYRPELHAQYRELIASLAGDVLAWTMLQLTLSGGLNLFRLHTGSALELLGAILFSSPAAWIFLHFM